MTGLGVWGTPQAGIVTLTVNLVEEAWGDAVTGGLGE